MKLVSVKDYWDKRYAKGETSGIGSYGANAKYKISFLNDFIKEHRIKSVLDFGCGDGNQILNLCNVPYVGMDISIYAVNRCRDLFVEDENKDFTLYNPDAYSNLYFSDMSMSLDVIYHLVDDNVYQKYIQHLFESAERYVIIYSSNYHTDGRSHVKHREFTKDIDKTKWKQIFHEPNPNGNEAEFYVFERINKCQ